MGKNQHKPRYSRLQIACVGLLSCLFLAPPANAGLLRDRLQARLAERQAAVNNNDEFTDAETTSSSLPAGVRVLRNLAYGPDEKQRLDVYLPTQTITNAPVIFMVHGGAWRTGDKAMNNVVENKVARWVPKGVVFISVNYRLLPQTDPLSQADDVATALAFAQKNATKWHADPTQFVLMGHSAGAHLVSLLAADPSLANKHGDLNWLGTIALDSAAYDLPAIMANKHYRFYDKAFGADSTYWQAASPFWQLQPQQTNFLAICSTKRPDSPCDQASQFVLKAQQQHFTAMLQPEPLTHKEINQQLGLDNDYTHKVEAFMTTLSQPLCQRIVSNPATMCFRN
jgi:arylformamidase